MVCARTKTFATMFKAITRTVLVLSLISLFNDAASELLDPL